ncbi:MAG: hypothetical protein ACM30G_15475 [Micromonosporaceae bacterium]
MSNYSDRLVKRLGAALTVYAIVWFIATFGTFAALEWTGHRAMEGEVMPWLALAVLPAPGLARAGGATGARAGLPDGSRHGDAGDRSEP